MTDWMDRNRLKMNADKTQIIWVGTRQQLAKVNISELRLLSVDVPFSTTVSDLGVKLDGQLSMSDHIATVCRSCFFQLRQLRAVRRSLTDDTAKSLVHAFISSRLDYCNSLLMGVADGLLKRLQLVQNAAARLVTGTRKFDHITPVLRALHWLPVCQRIIYKIAMLIFRCLCGLAPPYLAQDCVPLSSIDGRNRTRSAANRELHVPRTRTITFGDRAFAVTGPTTWNSLPPFLRLSSVTIERFKNDLKTHLFV